MSSSITPSITSLPPRVLATDLDGTFLPRGEDELSPAAMRQIRLDLRAHGVPLVFVTGRHFDFVLDAIQQHDTPMPDWILCDVGVSAYRRDSDGEFQRDVNYEAILDELVGDIDIETHRQAIGGLESFRLQEPFKQGRHKWSYYVPADKLDECHAAAESYLQQNELPCGVISSIDPFTNDGLVDVLPRGVSKAFALHWWCEQNELQPEQVVFCGDSGNDYAALVAGYRSVVVGNAERKLARKVFDAHRDAGWCDRLKLADGNSTAGVMEGMRWFGLTPDDPDADPGVTFGAKLFGSNRAEFWLWAPKHKHVALHLPPDRIELMRRQDRGFHHCVVDGVAEGTRYQYRFVRDEHVSALDSGTTVLTEDMLLQALPDPASRFQPDGVHGPSMIVSTQFPFEAWTPTARQLNELVIYELHVGTFTDEGTFASAIDRLDELVDLGVTAIEMMPIAECAGRWNWGYDGTHWFAPMSACGSPEDLRRLVDAAHVRGLLVFTDVVYNHFGPEGNYWSQFGPYTSRKHSTVWGAAPNFDDPKRGDIVRKFVIDNAIMWLDEFNLDGLRVDAIHCMKDDSPVHIATQMGDEIRRWSDQMGRRIWLIAETNVYDDTMVVPIADGGCGFDAQWSDDFVHSLFATVVPGEQLTQRTYSPSVDLQHTLRRGFLFRGDVRGYRGRETTPVVDANGHIVRADTTSSIICLQNHDFIGNHPTGKRIHQLTSPETQAAAVTLVMLLPSIPMLFMGEEFASENPFQFFVDFGDPALKRAVVRGRKREYPQHDWSGGVLPTDEAAKRMSVIGAAENGNAAMRDWYQTLIGIRKRFVASGLLATAHLSIEVDADADIYSAVYSRSGAGKDAETLRIDVRLTALVEDGAALPPVDWPASADTEDNARLLADSLEAFGHSRELAAMPNHARVTWNPSID